MQWDDELSQHEWAPLQFQHLSVLRIEPNVRGKEIPKRPKLKRGVREEPQWAASEDGSDPGVPEACGAESAQSTWGLSWWRPQNRHPCSKPGAREVLRRARKAAPRPGRKLKEESKGNWNLRPVHTWGGGCVSPSQVAESHQPRNERKTRSGNWNPQGPGRSKGKPFFRDIPHGRHRLLSAHNQANQHEGE